MEEGHGSWRRKEKGRYPRKKRLKNSASPQPARGSSALCLQCLLPPHFPGQGTTDWFYLNCYQGKFLNYTGWWGWLKKCPISQPWKKSQVSYCTLLPQQFRLLLGFKCLWWLFFFSVSYASMWGHVHLSVGAYRDQKRASEPLEVEYRRLWAAQHGGWKLNLGPLQK